MPDILVVSDSHDAPKRTLARLADEAARHGVSRVIHLGDGERDGVRLAELLDVPLIQVQGNCDRASQLAGEITLSIEGVKLLIHHGHLMAVKLSPLRLLLRAQELGARVALYGHTHRPHAQTHEGVLLLNPGALMDGRYAILRIVDGAASCTLCTLTKD